MVKVFDKPVQAVTSFVQSLDLKYICHLYQYATNNKKTATLSKEKEVICMYVCKLN